jgi:hypothetical protein
MTSEVRYFVIYGVTNSGNTFRPSDWAERLAGVLAPYRPPATLGGHLSYSPYAVPSTLDGMRCVVVDERLRQIEPLAWKFVQDFARDNQLQTKRDLTEDPLVRLG